MPDSTYRERLPSEFSVGAIVCVDDCQEEGVGLIGIIDEFLDDGYEAIDDPSVAIFCSVYFPITRKNQEKHGFSGINDFPGTVMAELRANSGKRVFRIEVLEQLNPEEI